LLPPIHSSHPDKSSIIIMKHLAAYLLLQLGGTENPTKEQITEALATVGVSVDTARLDTMMSDLAGKDIGELVTAGKEYLATFGGGGGGGGSGAAEGAAAAAAVEAPKEEEVEEEMDMGGAVDMFGSGDAAGGGGDY
jgi:large subunit ribosomal protein LP2